MDVAVIFTTSFIVAFSGAMMPGPLLAVTVGETIKRGFWAGPMIIAGHALLELILVVLLILGAAALLSGKAAETIIGLVGGVFLLFLGWSMIRNIFNGKTTLPLGNISKDLLDKNTMGLRGWAYPVGAGFLSSLANPYWSIWWATVGLLYITQALESGYLGVSSFFVGHISADLVWYSLVSAAVAGGRQFISQKIYNNVLMLCGIFILLLGAYFIKGAVLNLI